jgi:GTPase involved in cell partitioning and DNA repair
MAVVPIVSYTRDSLTRFIDECSLDVKAGNGGNDAIALRREKFIPLGGPAGADGSRGVTS